MRPEGYVFSLAGNVWAHFRSGKAYRGKWYEKMLWPRNTGEAHPGRAASVRRYSNYQGAQVRARASSRLSLLPVLSLTRQKSLPILDFV